MEHLFSIYSVPEIFFEGFPGEDVGIIKTVRYYRDIQMLDATVLERREPKEVLLKFQTFQAMYSVTLDSDNRLEYYHIQWVKGKSISTCYYRRHREIPRDAIKFLSERHCYSGKKGLRFVKVTGRHNSRKIGKILSNVYKGLPHLLSRVTYLDFDCRFVLGPSPESLVGFLPPEHPDLGLDGDCRRKKGIVVLTADSSGRITIANEWNDLPLWI